MKTSDQIVPEELNLFSGESNENPFAVFAKMRKLSAVIPIPFPKGGANIQAWMVTRMEECMQVLKDHVHFTVDPSTIDDDCSNKAHRHRSYEYPLIGCRLIHIS